MEFEYTKTFRYNAEIKKVTHNLLYETTTGVGKPVCVDLSAYLAFDEPITIPEFDYLVNYCEDFAETLFEAFMKYIGANTDSLLNDATFIKQTEPGVSFTDFMIFRTRKTSSNRVKVSFRFLYGPLNYKDLYYTIRNLISVEED